MSGRNALVWARAAYDITTDLMTAQEREFARVDKITPLDFAKAGQVTPDAYMKATCAALRIIKNRDTIHCEPNHCSRCGAPCEFGPLCDYCAQIWKHIDLGVV